MARPDRHKGFTLVELAIVIAIVGISMSLGMASIVEIMQVQARNAALAQANLSLREERARALETRRPRYVKPDPTGTGLVIGSATIPAGGTSCVDGPIEQRIELPGVEATGDRVCFTEDGNTDTDVPLNLAFGAGSSTTPLATVDIFPAGTVRWSGTALFQKSSGMVASISVQNFAAKTVNPIYLQ